jgi:hypothetical protein
MPASDFSPLPPDWHPRSLGLYRRGIHAAPQTNLQIKGCTWRAERKTRGFRAFRGGWSVGSKPRWRVKNHAGGSEKERRTSNVLLELAVTSIWRRNGPQCHESDFNEIATGRWRATLPDQLTAIYSFNFGMQGFHRVNEQMEGSHLRHRCFPPYLKGKQRADEVSYHPRSRLFRASTSDILTRGFFGAVARRSRRVPRLASMRRPPRPRGNPTSDCPRAPVGVSTRRLFVPVPGSSRGTRR